MRNLSITCLSVVVGLAAAGPVLAQEQFQYRFAAGTYCG
jgi:hypothetical protein